MINFSRKEAKNLCALCEKTLHFLRLKNNFMNTLKKILGFAWMLLAPIVIFLLVSGALNNIDGKGTKDINQPVPWIIIISIFTPIAAGLFIFGYYCVKGEYSRLPENSEQV